MRVLYVLDGFPALSESYIRTEIEWAVAEGAEVRVHAKSRIVEGSYASPVPVDYGPRPDASVKLWKPDVVHHHYLEGAVINAPFLEKAGVPVTVRGHSVDHKLEMLNRTLQFAHVKKVFLFPQFMDARRKSNVVREVTAAYDPSIYRPQEKDWRLVFRAATGKPGKDLEGFLRVAKAMREKFRFILAVSRAHPFFDYVDGLVSMNRAAGSPAEILVNLPREDVAHIMGRAGFCLRGFDPAPHPYGMPQSIAEAMGTGAVPVLPDCEGARAYAGPAGLYYKDHRAAAELLWASTGWSEDERRERVRQSVGRSGRYAAKRALAPIWEAWSSLVAAGVSR